ncbi:MAG: sigma-70 family RNA polymerase sigma factor [Cyclobacteriaceae bacterium]|nr:sigma-70 family RNA polymerase sigma factor [Cyclobacteriaceae bacterium]
MNQAHAISLYQPLLHQIAYNLLRCKADAEDIVQDTFVKWLSIDHSKIENTKAYLIRSVTNNCLNHINSLKRKKEEYWDVFQLSELMVKFKESDFANIDFEKELSAAFKLIHLKLEPIERAAYILKEVFDYEYDELQKVLDRKADNCRQIISRARKKLNEERDKINFNINLPDTTNLFESFKKACHLEDASEFVQQLKADINSSIQQKK